MSLYPDKWPMGTSRDAESQRGDKARRPRIPASPYQHLPVTQKAMAPHTGIEWWETNPDDRDIMKQRELMECDPVNLSDAGDGTFRKYGKKSRDVRILAYGWDKSFTSSDVQDAIYKMKLPLMQQLEPSIGRGIPSVDIRLHHLDVFTWWLLKTRSGHINGIMMSFRMAVGEGDGAQPLHAWCHITNVARHTFEPSDFPYEVEQRIKRNTGIDIIINTMNLKNDWLEATCMTGRLDCAVQKPSHWNQLQKQPYENIYLQIQNLTGKGSVCAVSAAEGQLRFIDKPGPFRLDVVNVSKRTRPEDIMRLFTKFDITWKGYSIRGTGGRHTITMGFDSLPQQIAGAKLLALRAHPGINSGMPLRVDVSYDYPSNQCRKCYNPNNKAGYSLGHIRGLGGDRGKCPNIKDICSICKSHDHTIKNCPYVATKLILKPREDVVFEDTTLNEAALLNLETGASAAKHYTPSGRSMKSSTIAQVSGFSDSSSDDGTHPCNPPLGIIVPQKRNQWSRNRSNKPGLPPCTWVHFLFPLPVVLLTLICPPTHGTHMLPRRAGHTLTLVALLALLASCSCATSTQDIAPTHHKTSCPPNSSSPLRHTLLNGYYVRHHIPYPTRCPLPLHQLHLPSARLLFSLRPLR